MRTTSTILSSALSICLACCTASGSAPPTQTDATTAAGGDAAPAKDAATAASDVALVADGNAGKDAAAAGDADAASDGLRAPDVAPPAPVALDQLQAGIVTALCQQFQTCPPGLYFASQKSCETFLTVLFGSDDSAVYRLAALCKSGKVTYDPAAAGVCIQAIATTCNLKVAQLSMFGPCQKAFVGTAKTGETCTDHPMCATGWCDPGTKALSDCPGKCAPWQKLGQACAFKEACGPMLTCIDGKCTPAENGKLGDGCDTDSCGAGLYCNGSYSGSAVCATLLDEGAVCTDTEACLPGLFCGKVGKAGKGICTKQLAMGAPCPYVTFAATPGTNFGPHSSCANSGQCVPKPGGQPGEGVCIVWGKLGEPCAGKGHCAGFDAICADIKDGKGVCQVVPDKGGKCTPVDKFKDDALACQLPYECDPATLTCGDPPGLGKSCQLSCSGDLQCTGGKCQQSAKIGESCAVVSCAKGGECIKQNCEAIVCGP